MFRADPIADLMSVPNDPSRRGFLVRSAAACAAWAALPVPLRSVHDARVVGGSMSPADDYTIDPAVTYLNHGSIGTMPKRVQDALCGYVRACESNPWLHMWGGAWDAGRDAARAELAALLGVVPDDLAITRNTTEGFNVLARGLPLGKGDEVLFTSLNHAGASLCFEHAAEERGYAVRRVELPLEEAITASADDLVRLHADAVGDRTRVVVLPHVDNMVGIRHPVAAIAAAVRARGVRHVFVDCAQTIGMLPVDVAELGVDACAGSPHKWVQAPKGTGFLWTTPELREVLRPLIVTWGQGRWAGSARVYEDYGTRDLANVLALGEAAAFQRERGVEPATARRAELFAAFRDAIDDVPDVEWFSPKTFERGASLFCLRLPRHDAEDVSRRLFEEHGVVTRGFGIDGGWLRISPNVELADERIVRFTVALREVMQA